MKTDDDLRASGEPPAYPQQPAGFKGFLASRGSSAGDDVAPPSGRVSLMLLVAFVAAIGLLGGWSTLFVILAIVFMIFLHELGHFLTAKAAGMKVTEFFLGFGPTLWSFRRGETEYGVKAIPAGAYVRILGMHNLEAVSPEDEPRTYRQKPFWRRLSVAVAGSTMHFLIALTCIWAILVFNGAPGSGLFRAPVESTNWSIDQVTPDSGAASAGLQPGDKIVAFGGSRYERFSELRPVIQASAGKTVSLVVQRAGAEIAVTATIGEEDGHGLLGIRPHEPGVVFHKDNAILAVPKAFGEFGVASVESVKALGSRFSPAGISSFAGQVADGGNDNSPVVSNGQVGSSTSSTSAADEGKDRFISIVGAVGIGAEFTRQGWAGLVFFLALVNIFIGIFNLVPMLPLDGGHVAIAVYEKVRSMLQRGRPYHADVAKLLPLTYAVVLLLIFVGVSSLYLDIVKPIHLN